MSFHHIGDHWINVESVEDLIEFVPRDVYPALCEVVDSAKAEGQGNTNKELTEALETVERQLNQLEKRLDGVNTVRTTSLERYLLEIRDTINPFV